MEILFSQESARTIYADSLPKNGKKQISRKPKKGQKLVPHFRSRLNLNHSIGRVHKLAGLRA